MARPPKPWYRNDRQCWYVTIHGVRRNLGPDKEAAEDQFHQLMLNQRWPETVADDGSLAHLLDEFYSYSEQEKKASTFSWYKNYLQDFLDYLEGEGIETDRLAPADLRPKDVRAWVSARGTAKRARITTIKAAYSWGYEDGWIDNNPIGGMKRGKESKRQQLIPMADMRRILRHTHDRCFRELLIVSWDTGARPQEITGLTYDQVELDHHRCVLDLEDSKDPVNNNFGVYAGWN